MAFICDILDIYRFFRARGPQIIQFSLDIDAAVKEFKSSGVTNLLIM